MSQKMRKVVAEGRRKSPFTRAGKSQKEGGNSLSCKLNVNEEYKEAFRTKSYMEMWSKAQGQLGRITSFDKLSSTSSLPNFHDDTHLTECLLEPQQKTLIDMMESLNFHHFLVDYFEASLEAYNICELLLRSIHQMHANYRRIKRVIKISKRLMHDSCTNDHQKHQDELSGTIFRELLGFSLLKNPFLIISPMKFRDVHDRNMVLLRRLTSKHKKIKRRAKFNRFCKRVGGYILVFSHGTIVIALLVIAFHSVIGILAAPGLVSTSFTLGLLMKKRIKGKLKTISVLDRICAQLDIAAKGIFILINDFDTISRLVRRLHDEVEHQKAVADMCVKNLGKTEVLKEVVKEFNMHEFRFLELLEELEEHIYLCFHTINRSRRLVLEEILMSHSP